MPNDAKALALWKLASYVRVLGGPTRPAEEEAQMLDRAGIEAAGGTDGYPRICPDLEDQELLTEDDVRALLT